MFKYLPVDAPVRQYTESTCHVGFLRATSEYYERNSVISELRLVAERGTPEECNRYVSAITDIKARVNDLIDQHVYHAPDKLAKAVAMDLLWLQAMLHTTAHWSIVEHIANARILDNRHGSDILNAYIAKLYVNMASAELYKMYWDTITRASFKYAIATTQET